MIKNVNGMLRKITYFRINVIVWCLCLLNSNNSNKTVSYLYSTHHCTHTTHTAHAVFLDSRCKATGLVLRHYYTSVNT